MPKKYHIHTSSVQNRLPKIIKSGVIAWEEGCLKCARCVKKECVYKVYEKRGLDGESMVDSTDTMCMDCFRCVQNCPNRLIQKGINPLYRDMGDEYWTPDIISNIWFQAETGRIPVSGAGYGGPFSGPGFDSMWTDMSEIVRPTRDGIHGREYISTTVDIGRKPMYLEFGDDGSLLTPIPPLVEIPLPVIFDLLPFSPPGDNIPQSLIAGARSINTYVIMKWSYLKEKGISPLQNIIPFLDGNTDDIEEGVIKSIPIIEIPDRGEPVSVQNRLNEINPQLVVMIRVELAPGIEEKACDLTKKGAHTLHLCADEFGNEQAEKPLFIKDRVRSVHGTLVEKGIRDQVTLLASGGIAMAEHMAKLIICGADCVAVDIPLLVAMECRICRRCKEGLSCPAKLETVEPQWGGKRITNLMGGWHNQLLEVLGAMGMREVRRLRGEMGRAMFFEDLEREVFSNLGQRGQG
ncbi:MAG: glutamate synthase-related protein [Syntrophorhabdaceae bacterium]|nr:glutamate synthase-related protein [Syntrophorhabdaceae bacterium]